MNSRMSGHSERSRSGESLSATEDEQESSSLGNTHHSFSYQVHYRTCQVCLVLCTARGRERRGENKLDTNALPLLNLLPHHPNPMGGGRKSDDSQGGKPETKKRE